MENTNYRNDQYAKLEGKMARYAQLKGIPAYDNGEKLIKVEQQNNLTILPIDPNIEGGVNDSIYLRTTVLSKIKKIAKKLQNIDPKYQLQLVYGFRPLIIQKALFLKFKQKLSRYYQDLSLLEAVHRKIAVPSVSGHPTGGAIDLQVVRGGKALNFGTKIWEFSKDSYTFSPFISHKGKENRKLLRSLMLSEGFAPFDGEWWHFSFGDKEWAYYYSKPRAIYKQIRSFPELRNQRIQTNAQRI